MENWFRMFSLLTSRKFTLCKWYLKNGTTMYMAVPELNEITESGFIGESYLEFAEIDKIEIERDFNYQSIEFKHDLEDLLGLIEPLKDKFIFVLEHNTLKIEVRTNGKNYQRTTRDTHNKKQVFQPAFSFLLGVVMGVFVKDITQVTNRVRRAIFGG